MRIPPELKQITKVATLITGIEKAPDMEHHDPSNTIRYRDHTYLRFTEHVSVHLGNDGFQDREPTGGLNMRCRIGFLHPGTMGISLAATAKNSGHTVIWASEGRSPATRDRALSQDLVAAGTLCSLCETCGTITCICPPAAAEEVAHSVLAAGFQGLYVDANAISPARTRRLDAAMAAAGTRFVDGSVIGGPAWTPGRTRLYLAGSDAEEAAACFSAGPLETYVLGPEIGHAAALKMCFAAYTKGSSALLSAIMATAEVNGVLAELAMQWSRNGSDFAEQTERRVRGVTARAWRFAGELDEIADTFRDAGLPAGFGEAAAEIYRRTAHFKAAPELPPLDAVLTALTESEQ